MLTSVHPLGHFSLLLYLFFTPQWEFARKGGLLWAREDWFLDWLFSCLLAAERRRGLESKRFQKLDESCSDWRTWKGGNCYAYWVGSPQIQWSVSHNKGLQRAYLAVLVYYVLGVYCILLIRPRPQTHIGLLDAVVAHIVLLSVTSCWALFSLPAVQYLSNLIPFLLKQGSYSKAPVGNVSVDPPVPSIKQNNSAGLALSRPHGLSEARSWLSLPRSLQSF